MMMHLGMIVVTPGQDEPILLNDAAPYGATTITGSDGNRVPTVADQDAARELGKRAAIRGVWLTAGRTEWEKRHGAVWAHTNAYPD